MSSEVTQFVDSLMATKPGAPHSIQLEMDTDEDICAAFEIMLLIMTDILKRWFSPPILISRISDEKHALLIDYFASFGIGFHLDAQESGGYINNREYLQQSRLDQMKFQLSHENKVYTVRFSNLRMT